MAPNRKSARLTRLKLKKTPGKLIAPRAKPKKRVLPPKKAVPPAPEYFRLLDLPLDIRKEIYDYFVGNPKEESTEETRAVKRARQSLLSVNRQINYEWTPLFYRTANIEVRPHKVINAKGIAPDIFEQSFLKVTNTWMLSNIRKLSYNAVASGPGASDFAGLRVFARILNKYIGHLQCLDVVNLHSSFWRTYGRYCQVMPQNRPDAQEAWQLAGESGQWDKIETLYARRIRGAALINWQVNRKATIRCFSTPQRGEHFWVATHVGLQFRRQHDAQSVGSSGTMGFVLDINYVPNTDPWGAENWVHG